MLVIDNKKVKSLCSKVSTATRMTIINKFDVQVCNFSNMENMAGLAAKTNGKIYILKSRTKIDNYKSFTDINWETIGIVEYRNLIGNQTNDTVIGKYYIVELGDDK